MNAFLIFLIIPCILAHNWKPYDNKTIFRIPAFRKSRLPKDAIVLNTFSKNETIFHDVVASRHHRFTRSLVFEKATDIPDDLVPLIKNEAVEIMRRRVFNKNDHPMTLDLKHQHNYEEVMAFIDATDSYYPSIATKLIIGKSFEERDITGLKLSINNGKPKKSIVVISAVHAREWVTVTATMALTLEVLKQSTLLDEIDFFIIPISNPDGYVYSWQHDRLWRKTRSSPNGTYCFTPGVDMNRNFAHNWKSNFVFCSEDYPGKRVASEPEVVNISNFLKQIDRTSQFVAFFDVHSYGNELLFPGGDCRSRSFVSDTNRMASRVFTMSTKSSYISGSVCQLILYPVYGAILDYVAHFFNVPIVMTPEIGDATFSFMPNPAETYKAVTDFTNGVIAVVKRVKYIVPDHAATFDS